MTEGQELLSIWRAAQSFADDYLNLRDLGPCPPWWHFRQRRQWKHQAAIRELTVLVWSERVRFMRLHPDR